MSWLGWWLETKNKANKSGGPLAGTYGREAYIISCSSAFTLDERKTDLNASEQTYYILNVFLINPYNEPYTMKYPFLLFALILPFFLIAQIELPTTFLVGEQELGRDLVVDDSMNVYILSQEQDFTNQRNFARIRKLTPTGEEVFSFRLTIEDNRDSYAKDLLLTSDGELFCLFVKGGSGPVTNGVEYLVIQKIDTAGNLLSEFTEMFDPNTSASLASMNFAELADGGVVYHGPPLLSTSVETREMVVAKFDSDFNLLKSMSTGCTSFRQRCFAVVGDDLFLTGTPASGGPKVQLLNLADSSIVWEQTLQVDGIAGNFIYSPVMLPGGDGYGIVTDIGSSIDSLEGIWYFNLGLDGEIRSQAGYRQIIPSNAAFPSIVLDYKNEINVLFGAFNEDTVGVTRHLIISESGEIECDELLDLGIGREQMRKYVSIESGQLLGVGSARDSTNTSSVVLLATVDVDKIIDGISPGSNLNKIGFTVYPNPVASEVVHLSFPGLNNSQATYGLYAENGVLVKNGYLEINENVDVRLFLKGLRAGVYFMFLKTEHGFGVQKVIVR